MNVRVNRRDFLKGLSVTLPFVALQMSSASWALQEKARAHTNSNKPNILILLFDTLSATNVSLYDYVRATAPNFDHFADQANVYHNHYSGGNFTSSGTATLLTSTYPWTHRAFHLNSTVVEDKAQNNIFNAFDDEYYKIAYTHNPLATDLLHQFKGNINQLKPMRDLMLSDMRYSERLFSNDFSASNLAEQWVWAHSRPRLSSSLLLSFADWVIRFEPQGRRLINESEALFPRGFPNHARQYFLLEDVVDWLASALNNLPQPFLAYIHVMPPHAPYNTRRDFFNLFADDGFTPVEKPLHFSKSKMNQQDLDNQRRLYDEFILYADAEFGRLLDLLEQRSLLDNTLTMVTSDHGELFERGIKGHITPALYQPIIRVPLLIRQPGQREKQDIRIATSSVDILPTLLHTSGQSIPDWSEGRVLPGFAGGQIDRDRSIFSIYAMENPKMAPLDRATLAMIKGDFKLIQNRGQSPQEAPPELYNLADDPEELNNVYQKESAVASSMQEELETTLQAADIAR